MKMVKDQGCLPIKYFSLESKRGSPLKGYISFLWVNWPTGRHWSIYSLLFMIPPFPFIKIPKSHLKQSIWDIRKINFDWKHFCTDNVRMSALWSDIGIFSLRPSRPGGLGSFFEWVTSENPQLAFHQLTQFQLVDVHKYRLLNFKRHCTKPVRPYTQPTSDDIWLDLPYFSNVFDIEALCP